MEGVSLQTIAQQLEVKKAQVQASVVKLQMEANFNLSDFYNDLGQRVDILVASGGNISNADSYIQQEISKAMNLYQFPLENEMRQAFNLQGIIPFAAENPWNTHPPAISSIGIGNNLQLVGEKLLQKKEQVEASVLRLQMEIAVNLIGYYDYLIQRVTILAAAGGSIPNPVMYLQEEMGKASNRFQVPLALAIAEAFNLQAVFSGELRGHCQQQASSQAGTSSAAAANQPENEANSGIVSRVEEAIVEEESDHLEQQEVIMSDEAGSVAVDDGNDSNADAVRDETVNDHGDSDAANLDGPSASTGGRQDDNNQEEMLGVVLENTQQQQQAEQRLVNAVNQTLNQPAPVSHSPVVSIIANQAAQVNPPGESTNSQVGVNCGQNDAGDSLDVSIKREVDSSSESESESESDDDDEMQVKKEATEEADIVSNSSPHSSPSNAEQSINSSQLIAHSNPDNQINMNGNEIASHYENAHVDAEDDAVVESGNEDSIVEEDFSGEESDHLEQQEVIMSGDEGSVADDAGDDSNEDESMDEANDDEDVAENMSDNEDEDQSDHEEEAQAARGVAGPSSNTLRRSTRQSARVTQASSVQEQQVTRRVSRRQTVPAGRSSNGARNGRNVEAEPLGIIIKKINCPVPGCKKFVKSKTALNGHLLLAHKLKEYRCLVDRCFGKVSTSFTTQAQFSDHIDRVHGRTRRLACICSKKFKAHKQLYAHYWKYHELGRFACHSDGCTFKPATTRVKVLHHQYKHREANYDCPAAGCDLSFKQKCDLVKHTRTHTGERPYPCTQCDLSFTRKDVLKQHLQRHRSDK